MEVFLMVMLGYTLAGYVVSRLFNYLGEPVDDTTHTIIMAIWPLAVAISLVVLVPALIIKGSRRMYEQRKTSIRSFKNRVMGLR